MNRIYHSYTMLEETVFGMWRVPCGEEMRNLNKEAVLIMSNIKVFSASMLRVVNEWKYSCEHNLTSIASNRVAWLGQAAVCIASGAPESCARVGWYYLSDETKAKANLSAERMIAKWEEMHIGYKFGQLSLFGDL